eukprot:COSAG06_NODE_7846_length_2354_cov_65.049224_2_plen_152_part_00
MTNWSLSSHSYTRTAYVLVPQYFICQLGFGLVSACFKFCSSMYFVPLHVQHPALVNPQGRGTIKNVSYRKQSTRLKQGLDPLYSCPCIRSTGISGRGCCTPQGVQETVPSLHFPWAGGWRFMVRILHARMDYLLLQEPTIAPPRVKSTCRW